uniref:Ovule protein n=1 Tax=Ascaris lumbricoides TaxID=6252 RepID=A0A0M3IXI6_ASCLU
MRPFVFGILQHEVTSSFTGKSYQFGKHSFARGHTILRLEALMVQLHYGQQIGCSLYVYSLTHYPMYRV